MDNVGNSNWLNFSFIVDNSTPILTSQSTGYRNGTCTSTNWTLSATSTDLHSDSSVQISDNGIWNSFISSRSFPSGYNSTIQLRAVDAMGLSSTPSTWQIFIDDANPIISANLSAGTVRYAVQDDCSTLPGSVRWESYNGSFTSWYQITNNVSTIPSILNGSIIRAHIRVSDELGNIGHFTTPWGHTNGSFPTSAIYVLSDTEGSFIEPHFNLLLSPLGSQTTSTWNLYRNNQAVSNDTTSGLTPLSYNFSNGDQIDLQITTTGALNATSYQNYSWLVDAINQQAVSIFPSGSYNNNSSFIFGPTGRLSHSMSIDDVNGAGGDFVECSWGGETWWQSSNSQIIPQGVSGTNTNFNFGCRAVDLLGNRGPTTWQNGTLDLTPPTVSISPVSSTIIALDSSLSFLSQDSNGILSTSYFFTWQNSSATIYQNETRNGGVWNTTSSQIFGSVGDGLVSISVRSFDLLGNSVFSTGHQWQLNTTTPLSSIQLFNSTRMFLPMSGGEIRLSPPTNGWTGVWMNYTLNFNGSAMIYGNSSSMTVLQPTFQSEGFSWLNVSTGDSFGHYQNQSWQFTIDGAVLESPQFSIQGHNVSNSTSSTLGPYSKIQISNVVDDTIGVGEATAECTFDGINWFTSENFDLINPPSFSNTFSLVNLRCQNIDYFSNSGPVSWYNFTIDTTAPLHSLTPTTSYIAPDYPITITASDVSGISTTLLELEWTDGTTTIPRNISSNSALWNTSIASLFGILSDGIISGRLISTDNVGNVKTSEGYSWSLTTSEPTPTVSIIGNAYANFISPEGAIFLLGGQSGGNGEFTLDYTITAPNGTIILQGNTSSQLQRNFTFIDEGNVVIFLSISDEYGRVQNRSWIYSVDGSVNTTPTFSVNGLNISGVSKTWLGSSSNISLGNRLDDSGGVGYQISSCSWDNMSWFDVPLFSNPSASILDGQHQEFQLSCRNTDLLGNIGPMSFFNFSTDTILPSINITPPSQSYISPTTILNFSTSDENGIWYSELNLTWTNGGNSWHESRIIYTQNWSSQLTALRNTLSDGTVQVQLRTFDRLGNLNTTLGIQWQLSTVQPLSSVSTTGEVSGTYLGGNFSISISPPSLGSQTAVAEITLESQNDQHLFLEINNTTSFTYDSTTDFENGSLWLNISTTDPLQRTQTQIFLFTIDRSVSTSPNLQFGGQSTTINGSKYISTSAGYTPSLASDDSWGVGGAQTSCTWNGIHWFTAVANTRLIPSSILETIQNFQLQCRVVDTFGNFGPKIWRNGSVDAQKPAITFATPTGSLLSKQTVVNSSCSDFTGCTLNRIVAAFTVGNTVSWHQLTLSGTNTSLPLSTVLNVTSQGTVMFYVTATDGVGNTFNSSTPSYQYLHLTPTASLSITSNNYQNYIDSNLSFLIAPSTGWLTGIDVNLSVREISSQQVLFNSSINQSTSSHSFSNLSEGQIHIQITICDQIIQCSTSLIVLVVDSSGPSGPQFTVPNNHILSNGSIIGRAASIVNFAPGSDFSSGIAYTNCSTNFVSHSFSSLSSSLSFLFLLSSQSWATVSCYSVDFVGNSGNTTELTLFRDDELPTISLPEYPLDKVITPNIYLNATCSDDFGASLFLRIESGSTTVYSTNTSGAISTRFTNILGNTAFSSVKISLSCLDSAGNMNVSSDVLEWLPFLHSPIVTLNSQSNNNISYLSNSSIIEVDNIRQDIDHQIRYIYSGQYSNWSDFNLTQSTIGNIYPYLSNGADIQFQVRVSRHGSSLQNTTTSQSYRIDAEGPVTSGPAYTWYGNSTRIPILASDTGIGTYTHHWSFDNGTFSTSSNSADIVLPPDSGSTTWFTVYSTDLFGNIGPTSSTQLNRDFTSPVIYVNQSHTGYIGLNSSISVTIIESTGLQNSRIFLESQTGAEYVLANNSSVFTIHSSVLPSWAFTHTGLQLKIETVSRSQLFSNYQTTLIIDTSSPIIDVDQRASHYIHDKNTSNNSEVVFSGSPDIQSTCYKISSNTSSLPATCTPLENQTLTINRTQGPYVIYLYTADFAGNTNSSLFEFTHHTQRPSISLTLPNNTRPTSSYAVQYSPLHNPQLDISWENASLIHSTGTFQIPNAQGLHTIYLSIINDLGLSNSINISVNVDDTAPDLTIISTGLFSSRAGTNTFFWFNSSDASTSVSFISLNLTSGSTGCEISSNPATSWYSLNGTLGDIFSEHDCELLDVEGAPLSVRFMAIDQVGNIRENTTNITYFGMISAPSFTSYRAHQSNQTTYVGPQSEIRCLSSNGAILPVLELNWTGTVGSVSGDRLTNATSNGALTCTQSDAFGNAAVAVLNLTNDISDPVLSVFWPSSSFTNIVKASGPNFSFQAEDNEVPVTNMTYCISSQPCIPNIVSTGTTQFNNTQGLNYLTLRIENQVGLVTTNTTVFMLDNSPPIFNITANNNSYIDSSVVYIGFNQPNILIDAMDDQCYGSGTVKHNFGTQALSNEATNMIQLPTNIPYILVTVTDCVGHTNVQNLTVQTLNTIQPPALTISSNHAASAFFNGSTLVTDGSIELLFSAIHSIELNLTCSSTTGLISCQELPTQNQFIIILNASQSGSISLLLSDAVGNIQYFNSTILVDNQGPECIVSKSAVLNGSKLLLSSQFSSEFICNDLHGVSSVSWNSNSSVQHWNLMSGYWIAPVPSNQTVQFVATDEIGNQVITSLTIQFDDDAPVLSYSDISEFSFDENSAQSDGSFVVFCLDSNAQTCSISVVHTDLQGELIQSYNYTNTGQVNIQSLSGLTEVIRIVSSDDIGNIVVFSTSITIDDEIPEFSIILSNSRTGKQLNGAYLPSDGLIQISGLTAPDVNYTTSTIQLECLDTSAIIVLRNLTVSVNLGSENLLSCTQIQFSATVNDHAGNTKKITTMFTVDWIIPTGEIELDTTCSWNSGAQYDARPICNLDIAVVDDTNSILQGTYEVLIQSITNGDSEVFSVSTLTTISLEEYLDEEILVSISGQDKVGNQVASESISVRIRSSFEPVWAGVLCKGNTGCPLTGYFISTSTDQSIGFTVNIGEAPIVETDISFQRAGTDSIQITSNQFAATRIDEGEWRVSGSLKDAAGRFYSFDNLTMVYDNTPPEIEIDIARSIGYMPSNASVLSCDVCKFVIRFADTTNITSIINQDATLSNGYWTIQTSKISSGNIEITVQDEFDYQTNLSIPIVSVKSTSFEVIGLYETENIRTYCMEESGELEMREVVCLWKRQGLEVVDIPIPVTLSIDKPELRSVMLAIEADQAATNSIIVNNGQTILVDIPHYTSQLMISLVDGYSEAKPMRIRLLEHTEPWGAFDFIEPQLNETDSTSALNFRFNPPVGHEEFYVIKGGNAGVPNWLTCTSMYKFAELSRALPRVLEESNCQILELNLRADGTLQVRTSTNHLYARVSAGLSDHQNPLFNLQSLSILFEYSDVLGVSRKMTIEDLMIEEEGVLRAADSPATYSNQDCPLGYDEVTYSADGFLQSDNTMPLFECAGSFLDSDGIESVVWNFTFLNTAGIESYSFEIECGEGGFPQNWAFQDAFNAGQCTSPEAPFPSGVYDVRIRPTIRDSSVFIEDGLRGSQAHPLLGNLTQCEESTSPCYVEVTVRSVTVYPSFDPALEVENAAKFIESWQARPGASVVFTNVLLLGALLLFLRRSRNRD